MPNGDTKHYWKSPAERDAGRPPHREDEFPEPLEFEAPPTSRRTFLKAAGFTFAGAALTGCTRAPVEKAIPYLVQPEEMVPGRSYFYASTCAGCSAGCGLLARNRDGRPVKLEGNPEHPISRGGLCAVGQASILGLYDSQRLKGPKKEGRDTSWKEVDDAIVAELENIRVSGGAVRFLSGTITSPTFRVMIERFLKRFPNARHIVYDALSSSAILDAHERTHKVRALPRYHFEKADVVVSFDADFLGTWISPVEFAVGYRTGRALEGTPPRMSYHAQFEARMSLTGARADQRVRVAPWETGLVMTQLAALVAKRAGAPLNVSGVEESSVKTKSLERLADRLWEARGRSLVVCGRQSAEEQVLANFLNHALGNYGSTLDLERPSFQRQGNDRDIEALSRELRDGKVAALFVYGVNPVFDLPGGDELANTLKNVPLVVSFAERLDETASLARCVCPDHHYLESWSDSEAVAGTVSLSQPVLHPLGNTRSALESLAAWSGTPNSAYEILKESWQVSIFPRQKNETAFQAFWDRSVEAGFAEVRAEPVRVKPFDLASVRPILRAQQPATDGLSLLLYPKVGILDGHHAYNPWLHELPDPVSKVTWDNYACFSLATGTRLGVNNGDVVRLEVEEKDGRRRELELPAFLQPGQHDQVVAVALGYGSKLSARFAHIGPKWLEARPSVGEDGLVGKNAAPFLEFRSGNLIYTRNGVKVAKAGRTYPLASTQTHQRLDVPGRPAPREGEGPAIIEETTLAALLKKPVTSRHPEEKREDLWPPDHPYTGHRWGMVIDLNACTGCSACVVSCQAENNIPVVGKDEVRRTREMHWLRIDQYYVGEGDAVDVAHQPMLCQQCENAPCETVCPVLATVHSEEGLNVQIYNRCVGTRYCTNNCPYKARRFNWFDYPREDRLQNLALNPDVTVRSRGIMEKCTFCLQRIQEAKIEAKRLGRQVRDGDIQTACQQSCPTQAIIFGDINDPKSRVRKLMASGRHYRVLEELNVRPSVGYLALVRNRDEGAEG